MKSRIIEREDTQEKEYPKLMKSTTSNLVIMIHKEGAGIVVNGDVYDIGYYCDHWDLLSFSLFHGKIELSNE